MSKRPPSQNEVKEQAALFKGGWRFPCTKCGGKVEAGRLCHSCRSGKTPKPALAQQQKHDAMPPSLPAAAGSAGVGEAGSPRESEETLRRRRQIMAQRPYRPSVHGGGGGGGFGSDGGGKDGRQAAQQGGFPQTFLAVFAVLMCLAAYMGSFNKLLFGGSHDDDWSEDYGDGDY